ncbi:DUF6401 family natural product biosynthesis protein [Thermobifida cellulosilytica]|uniref:Uncharacterized protein n=1 Tax=Thermobifida cellulosilytica TB100 TaxID=665004 RepID=A0A147KH33_THECS|nr:DUF6401 family natural product biosynthesis protein [Thermobifida cellulosilytica]KUP96602.1 hypothetical protein AC529_11495 [Thermobifida cellulosilytica TB100]
MRSGFSARCPLAQLTHAFDSVGLREEPSVPGLLAQVDQHVAAVRDALADSGVPLSRRSLAQYLRGFLDGCRERGWHSTEVDYDWETLRLLAICRLAREEGFVR